MRVLLAAPVVALTMGWWGNAALSQRAAMPAGSCRAGKDLVVQALERVRADSAAGELQDANELLKRAVDLCSESGEAWYYRSLVEAKLGHAPVAAYAMRQARLFPSEALQEQLNPFNLAVPKGAAPLGPVQRKWALVIGIGSFGDSSIQPLKYTKSDAELFRDVLVSPRLGGFAPEQVKLLVNGEATLRAIKEGLNWLARNANEEDLVVVYVASHGTAREVDTAGANYILTHDTETRENGDVKGEDALYATALPMVELANAVATRMKARRTAVFLDTCYSGSATTGSKLLAPGVASASISEKTLRQMDQGAGRVIVAASRTDEESLESDALSHGYFTYYLVDALQKHPGMPLSQVFATVREEVSARVAKDYRTSGLQQTPVMARSADDTDFALGSGSQVAQLGTR